jgi:cytochrome c oxidase assembly protein subunit 15
MFLYPLARMTGGIYYEHAHRLFGALVGLTTLALAAYTQWVERRGWAPILAWVAFLLVCCQGVLGGLRVTGRFTLSESAADLSPNLTLAMLHGVLAQVFFSTLCVLTLVQTRAWREWAAPLPRASAGLDFAAGLVTVAVLLLQLVFGAVLRHTASGLHLHLGFAGVAAVVAGGFGFRAWGRYEDVPILPRLGAALLALLGAQLLLGFAALGVTMMETGLAPAIQALVTTAHQTTGAALLACSVCATLWLRRAVAPVAGKQAPQGLERAV